MNIYEKLQNMRVSLQQLNLKKSGRNDYAGYNYYELGDFLPAVNQLMAESKVCSVITFSEDFATLTLINSEKPDDFILFTSPMRETTLKGAHAIQNLGATETYSRRYLYMTAFEIVEADVLDATQGKEKPISNNRQGQNKKQQRGQQKPPQQYPDISDANKAELNAAVAKAKLATGMDGNQIAALVEQRIGIKLKQTTDATASKVLECLGGIRDESMNH